MSAGAVLPTSCYMTQDTEPTQVETPVDPAPAEQAAPQQAGAAENAADAHVQDLERSVTEFKEKWLRAEAENQNLMARAKRDVKMPASTRCRNSRVMWWKPPKTCAARWTACLPRPRVRTRL